MELDQTIKIRLSSSQLSVWKAAAARERVSLSALIRAALLGRAIHKVPELNQQAWMQLAAAAANLNQLAHRLNFAHQVGEDMLLAAARDQAVSILDSLQALRAALLGARLDEATET